MAKSQTLKKIFLFFQIKSNPSVGNDNGCWNWWGYLQDSSGAMFATKNAVQMAAVFDMIDRMANLSK